jgi:transcriptional regulator with XRE-family HTH domain
MTKIQQHIDQMKNLSDFNDISNAIAKTLREYRKRERLSLDTLSKQACVSKGMLVDIERGTANPSVGLLCKISKVLGIEVSDLLRVSGKNPIILVNLSSYLNVSIQERKINNLLLGKVEDKGALELWSVNIYPEESYHPKKVMNNTTVLLYVMSGVIEIRLNRNLIEIAEGHSIVITNNFSAHNKSKIEIANVYIAMIEL